MKTLTDFEYMVGIWITLSLAAMLTGCKVDVAVPAAPIPEVTTDASSDNKLDTAPAKVQQGEAKVLALNPVSYWHSDEDYMGLNPASGGIVPDHHSLENNQFSVIAYFTPTGDVTPYQRIAEKGGYMAHDGGWSLEYSNGTTQAQWKLSCNIWSVSNGLVSSRVETGMPLSDKHVVACVYDGTNITLYLDGVAKASQAANYSKSHSPMGLFKAPQANGFQFRGTAGDILYFDRALIASEVLSLN